MWEDSRDIKSAKLQQPVAINPNSNFILLFEFSNSLSLSFSQDKNFTLEETVLCLSILFSVGKNYHIISAQKRAKKTPLTRFYVDKTPTRTESARATLCKLATCTRQSFLLAKPTITN